MNDICLWSATRMAAAIASGEVSPVELTTALLARIGQLDPALNVFTHLDAEGAMTAASVAEAAIARGDGLGPLHGVPIGVKDIIDVAGLPTTCHSAVLRNNMATMDADVVDRLRRAGAIILGKLATLEFAMGGPSFDLPFPPARNPWNREHHPGGSSSGSAAGLAARLFPLALGSDTGGSIRNPAAACGVMGLKPTYGLVSRRGVFPVSQTLDHVGPMARHVDDIALLLDVIAGYDPADPSSAKSSHGHYSRDLGKGIRSLRVGFVRNFHETDLVCDPEVGQALETTANVLRSEGAVVETVSLPPLDQFASVQATILYAEAWSVHAAWLRARPEDYGRSSRQRFTIGAFLSAEDLVAAQRARTQLLQSVEEVLSRFDVLLCANAMDTPVRFDDVAGLERTYPRQARTPFNVTGHPAISVMNGLSRNGLPLSAQFIGRYFHEHTILRVANAFASATPWHELCPPIDA